MNKKKLVFILTAGFLLLVVAKTNYKEINNENIISDSINYKQNFKSLAMYKNDGNGDEEITTMPESGYEINKEKSYCTTDNINKVYNKMYTDDKGNHIITGLEKDSKCYIYFNKKVVGASTTILGNITVNEGTPDFSQIADTDEGVFKAKDDDGDAYYYRGAVTNNYVKFADKFWRIIRINGDGTIRMIYDGETARENGSELTLEISAFNTSLNNNMYVGFRYTNGEVHGTRSESTILKKLNAWYRTNLESYSDKIDPNAGFCGDRTPSTSETEIQNSGSGGIGTNITYYGAYIRLKTNKVPVLTCPTEDFYTMTSSTKGNKSLTYPIGLITADEVSMAGGLWLTTNKSYYLYTGQSYWNLSPHHFNYNAYAYVFVIHSDGSIRNYAPTPEHGVRPVINLKADVAMTGTGTASDPYVVE